MFSIFFAFLFGGAFAHFVSYQELIENQWEAFKLEHGKFYQDSDEEAYRQTVFMENFYKITEHNKQYEMNLVSYKLGLNQFSDLTEEEFLSMYTMQNVNLTIAKKGFWGLDSEEQSDDDNFVYEEPDYEVDLLSLPQAVDWRDRGAVTQVKNQGQCGSCWTFSSTGTLEGQWYKKTKKLVSLSEQNLLDCSSGYGNHGCHGGWMSAALNYIKNNRGVDTEQSYPYQGRVGPCRYTANSKGATVRQVVQFQGESQLHDKVSSVGPIAVAIEVSYNFHHYTSGVYNEPRCGHNINHAVLVVGYGTEGGKDYWLVKNSWGTGWGDHGYIKMTRNRNSQCAIADYPTYPVV